MSPETPAHLWDAREACRAVTAFLGDLTAEEFEQDLLVRSAVERQLEILGEALNRIRRSDPEAATVIPEIDRIVGMRNILAHQYGVVDPAIVWAVATLRMEPLIEVFNALLMD